MNFSRALSYAFEDRDWLGKLALVFLLTVGAAVLTPLIVGLVLAAALLGYQLNLIQNVRAGVPHPLPRWNNLGDKITRGANILGALVVYNLPNGLIGCCVAVMAPSIGDTFTGAGIALGIACCIVPLLLAYNLIALPMQALGMARYGDEDNISAFFQFGRLFDLVRDNGSTTIQYLLTMLLANVVFTLLAIVPVLGWIAAPALALPVQGALAGQYASQLLGKPKGLPRQPSPRR